MALSLKQVRPCDQVCCKESPRELIFDKNGKKTCKYLDGKGGRGCAIQRGDVAMPNGLSAIFPGKSFAEVFKDTCVDWPHNSKPKIGKTGGCCWQWIEA